ncbi:AAA-like domain-containing protein [Hyalangium rubrum]|uniref:AAA-like domain-containing protein n=1 Tax=Hyalangium rubrum TaxID=3103134 RepID=A0ABU5HE30_9BACT|nr:AAA-like domain-containing protein [Hyalangium sp. s54d21]MDY7231369.1 AAA-like domain-containing protein [Hyalangium sp. s54d21]
MARVFISYKHTEPDSSVARALDQALRQAGHDVFVDLTLPVGVEWAKQIEAELQRTDFLVALLSGRSLQSEMTLEEIGTAWRLKKGLLPVRLAWREPFKYPLSAWLNPINWAFWDEPSDTPRVAEELLRAIAGATLPVGQGHPHREHLQPAPAAPLPQPLPLACITFETGAMAVESRLYIQRPADEIATSLIRRRGQTLNIKGARQMGKSSLLMHLLDEALKAGKRLAFIDFQEFDSAAFTDDDVFFRTFCASISEQLSLPNQVDTSWEPRLGNVQSCGRYVGNSVLKSLDTPLVLALDEVDRLLDVPFRSDFFGMLRSWHEKRAQPIADTWKKLDLVLVSSTEPYLLIDNLQQSPFNIGEQLELFDFSAEEVTRLNQLHGPAVDPEQERQLFALLGGHPYLVRRALYLIATKRMSASELLTHEDMDAGPFGDHLRHLLVLINRRQKLIEAMKEILLHGTCRDATLLYQLRSAGLERHQGTRAMPRCELYARYFRKHLLG